MPEGFSHIDQLPDSWVEAWGQGRFLDASEVLARAAEKGVELPADVREMLEADVHSNTELT
jgi:hypothetical protein